MSGTGFRSVFRRSARESVGAGRMGFHMARLRFVGYTGNKFPGVPENRNEGREKMGRNLGGFRSPNDFH